VVTLTGLSTGDLMGDVAASVTVSTLDSSGADPEISNALNSGPLYGKPLSSDIFDVSQ